MFPIHMYDDYIVLAKNTVVKEALLKLGDISKESEHLNC